MVLSHVGPRIWVSNVLCSLSVSQPVKHPSAHNNTHHQATVHPTGISHVGSPKFWQLYGRNRHLQVVNCDGDRQLQAAISPGLRSAFPTPFITPGEGRPRNRPSRLPRYPPLQASRLAITSTRLSISPGLELSYHVHCAAYHAGEERPLEPPTRGPRAFVSPAILCGMLSSLRNLSMPPRKYAMKKMTTENKPTVAMNHFLPISLASTFWSAGTAKMAFCRTHQSSSRKGATVDSPPPGRWGDTRW